MLANCRMEGNGKDNDWLRDRERAILEGPVPGPVSAEDEQRLIANDPGLAAALGRLLCWGNGCSDDELCGNCQDRRKYLALLLHRERFGRALHPSEVAKAHQAAPPPTHEPIEDAADPFRLARLFDQSLKAKGHRLRRWRETWTCWGGRHYREVAEADLRAELTSFIKAEYDRLNIAAQQTGQKIGTASKVTRNLLANVQLALESLSIMPSEVDQPAWYDPCEKKWTRPHLIALGNGLLDVDALFEGKPAMRPHSPNWFSSVALPYPFDPAANCPKWRAFLNRNLEGDPERIALLQEFMGYCLVPDNSRQKFLLMTGEGGGGKSTTCAALEAMLGSANVSHVPLEDFGERFALGATLGKLANISSEIGEIDKAAEGHLKSFTSGDPRLFDRKNKPPLEAIPSARLTLATNNLPRFSDKSGGLWRRMLLLPLRVVISDDDPSRIYGMDKMA